MVSIAFKCLIYDKTSKQHPILEPVELHQFGMVSSVSASGHYLFVGTQDGFVFINDLSKGLTQLYHRSISRRYICSMQFKNNVLAVASNEINIRLIDFSNGMDGDLVTFICNTLRNS